MGARILSGEIPRIGTLSGAFAGVAVLAGVTWSPVAAVPLLGMSGLLGFLARMLARSSQAEGVVVVRLPQDRPVDRPVAPTRIEDLVAPGQGTSLLPSPRLPKD